jgi:large subunit ribosomal protein L25
MKSVPLNAFPRALKRRGGSKKLREAGRIPAVIYGRQTKPENLEVQAKELEDLIHHSASENLLVDLAVKDDSKPKRLALLQEIQHHPLTGHLLHVDFHEVAENEKVTIMVPVESTGEPVGVKTGGGVLEHVLFRIRVRALPKDLPEVITVDVSGLNIGQSIHLGDIAPPPAVEILGDKHISVLAVAAPRSEEEEAAEAADAAAAVPGEVEMIKEKKEGEEEGAGKPGEKAGAKPGEKAPAKGAEKGAATPADKKAAAAPEKKK